MAQEQVKQAILNLIQDRNPNWVSEHIIRAHIPEKDGGNRDAIMEDLVAKNLVESNTDKRARNAAPIKYYRDSRSSVLFREYITIGKQKIPRIILYDTPVFAPENINESFEQLAIHHDKLRQQSEKLDAQEKTISKVQAEQKRHWAQMITVFTVLAGFLAVVLDKLPRTVTDPSLTVVQSLAQNYMLLLPFCSVILVFALLLYCIIAPGKSKILAFVLMGVLILCICIFLWLALPQAATTT